MSSLATSASPTVLVVDDDRSARLALSTLLGNLGYMVQEAADGDSALEALRQGTALPAVILLDRIMPRLDGLALARQLKADETLSHLPIVMVTGAAQPEEVREGIDAGVFYYLTKPVAPAVLASVVRAAAEAGLARQRLRSQPSTSRHVWHLATECTFTIRRLSHAEELAVFIAHGFPQPARVVGGILALLTNALEHGLLGLGFQTKGELLAAGTWRQEVENRCAALPQSSPGVTVVYRRQPQAVQLTVTDPGPGFNWPEYLEFSPARATAAHGRGIAQAAQVAFDNLRYTHPGNQVTASVSLAPTLAW